MNSKIDMHNVKLAPHFDGDSVRRSLKLYSIIGAILFIGTIFTYCIATVKWMDVARHGFDKWDAILGLGIASFKATMVADVFMHLNHERRLIYWVIALASLHAIGFFLGTLMHFADPIHARPQGCLRSSSESNGTFPAPRPSWPVLFGKVQLPLVWLTSLWG
ncbi:MAG: cytochrome C oxidase subunit IV family protein [Verrucomicrobiota bacterium]